MLNMAINLPAAEVQG